jgi:DNA-binding transcriptional LysR family regulator
MEIHHLRSFMAVAKAGNLTRAAEQLHLTQSAVSKHVKAFEEELRAHLFDRETSGMSITSEGRRLPPAAAAAAFLASSDSSFMTTSELAVDGGLAQL